MKRLGGILNLPATHPMYGRMAFQCESCHGISYPEHQSEDGKCPYCESMFYTVPGVPDAIQPTTTPL